MAQYSSGKNPHGSAMNPILVAFREAVGRGDDFADAYSWLNNLSDMNGGSDAWNYNTDHIIQAERVLTLLNSRDAEAAASSPQAAARRREQKMTNRMHLPGAAAGYEAVDGDGYDFMDANRALGWRQLADWGADGYDMGRWPLICVMTNDEFAKPRTLVYIEGDVEVVEFESVTDRTQYLDAVAEGFWRSGDADGPNDIAAYSKEGVPEQYRGPSTVKVFTQITTSVETAQSSEATRAVSR